MRRKEGLGLRFEIVSWMNGGFREKILLYMKEKVERILKPWKKHMVQNVFQHFLVYTTHKLWQISVGTYRKSFGKLVLRIRQPCHKTRNKSCGKTLEKYSFFLFHKKLSWQNESSANFASFFPFNPEGHSRNKCWHFLKSSMLTTKMSFQFCCRPSWLPFKTVFLLSNYLIAVWQYSLTISVKKEG